MSIVRTALRIATRKAIAGRTLLDDRVQDSSIDTLEAALTKKPDTIGLIYTEDTMSRPSGKELWPNGYVDLVILVTVAGAFKVKVKGTDEEVVEYRYPITDASSELTLDLIERQIRHCLMDPANPWAEIWKRLVTKVEYWNSQRGASSKEGARFAARQITARLHVIDDPVPGDDLKGAWKQFMQALRDDTSEDWGKMPDLLEGIIKGGKVPADYQDAMAVGATQDQIRAIGQGRVDMEVDGDPASLGSYRFVTLYPGRPR